MHGFQPEHGRGISPFGYLGLAMPHKFEVGQMVRMELPGAAWEDPPIPGTYTVTQQLPEREGVFEYSVTSPTEPYERVAIEKRAERNVTTLIATLGGAVAWPLFVDDQFKFGLLKDRQVGGCFAFENVAAVPGQTPKSSRRANVVQSSLSDASARLARQLRANTGNRPAVRSETNEGRQDCSKRPYVALGCVAL